MLQKVDSFKTSDGTLFARKHDALKHEMKWQIEQDAEASALAFSSLEDALIIMANKPDVYMNLLSQFHKS